MTFRFEMPYDLDSQLAATRAPDLRGWTFGITAMAFFGILTVLLLIHAVFNGVPVDSQDGQRVVLMTSAVSAALLVLAFAWQYFVTPIMLKKSFEELALSSKSSIYTLGDDGLVVEDEMFGGSMRWGEAREWIETDRFILVYRSADLVYNFDKSRIPDGAADFIRARLKSAGVAEG